MQHLKTLQSTATTGVCGNNPNVKQEKEQQEDDQPKIRNAFESIETVKGLRYLFNSFRFLGLYVPKNNKVLYFIWSLIINMMVTAYLPIGFSIKFMLMSRENIEIGDLLTSMQAFFNVIVLSLKVILMGYLVPKLLSLETIIKRLDRRCHTTEEMEIIKGFMKKGNRLVVLFTICYWSYGMATCFGAAIFKRLPFNIYNPLVDSKASNLSFFLAFCMEFFPVIGGCFQEVVVDSYAVIYVNILRTHLDILLRRIGNLNKNKKKSLEANLNELIMCIIDYKNIIELYDTVSPIISKTVFMQFTATATALGTTLINILLFATNIASTVASSIYLLAVIVQVFPLCYYAQCLMDENNCLSDALLHSDWVDQDIRYKKMLIFFIHRSQRPITFTAGKLFPITLATFLSIAKFSFSLYTFIKKMDIKDKLAA